jgi:uncharacterized protein YceH (UPF0502 family)
MNTTLIPRAAGPARPAVRAAGLSAAAGLLVAALAAGTLACGRDSRTLQLSDKPPASPEALLAELKDHKDRIDLATDQMMKRIEEYNTSRTPGERTIQFSEIFTGDLTDAQRDILNTMVAQEKDVSYKSLLEKIIADRDAIQGLQEKVIRLEQLLSDRFVLAKKGDSHHDLAMEFLINEAKVDPAKAKSLLAGIDLTDELLPGNKVWFFHDPEKDAFRTYVTQGEAGRTPLAVRRAYQRQLITERDAAQAAAQAAQAAVDTLEQVKLGLEGDIAGLRQNKAELEQNVGRLSRDLEFQQNSLFYHVASVRSLKDQGVLTPVLKRIRDVKGLTFDAALDLRQATTILLTPGAFGLERIKTVRMLPSIYQEGRDFSIETSEETGDARVVILDPSLFRGREVLIAVGG